MGKLESLLTDAPPDRTHGVGAIPGANASKPGLPIVGEGPGAEDDTAELEATSEGEGDAVVDGSAEEVTSAEEEDTTEEDSREEVI